MKRLIIFLAIFSFVVFLLAILRFVVFSGRGYDPSQEQAIKPTGEYPASPPPSDEYMRNWPQWRGPSANGIASTATPPVSWSVDDNVKWKVEVPGGGSASPVIWNDRVFVLTAVPSLDDGGFMSQDPHQFLVLCYDRETGNELWRQVAVEATPHEGHHSTGTFASNSPITDGEFVYASFGSRGIYCYDMDGDFQWKRDLGDLDILMRFGEGSSPALSGDTLVVPWDHQGQSSVVALDAKTGETRWKVEREEDTTWSTPHIVHANGRTQVILPGANRVRSYDIKNGGLIWRCGGQAMNPVASPVVDNDFVYCTTGFRGSVVSATPLTAIGDITDTSEVAWLRDDIGSYVPSPVLYKGHLYILRASTSTLSCLDAETGETIFGPERLSGLPQVYASMVVAQDRIYITGRNGATVVLQHGWELEVIATNHLEEGVDASMAMVDSELFIRGEKHLYCITED